jgi:carboxyl-terminal processing protease
MKPKVLWIALFVAFIVGLASYTYIKNRGGDPQLMGIVIAGFNSAHYSPQKVDDKFSEKVFDLFLKRADNDKQFLLQTDVNKLTQQFRDDVDNEMQNNSYSFLNASTDLLSLRIQDASKYYAEILSKPFDFTLDESYPLKSENIPWAKDSTQLRDNWRKYLKYETLIQLNQLKSSQDKAKEKNDTSFHNYTFAQLESQARDKVNKDTKDYFVRMSQLDSMDWLSLYLNCITNVEDPHSEYFAPQDKQNFDLTMSGQLQGIGAQLEQRDGDVHIASIVPGSPSYKQGKLKPGDIVLKVAQGNDDPVDISGMRLDKVVALIRGKKGTEVRLTVRKKDGTVETYSLIRDVVVLDATYAQSAVINEGDKKIGYLRLPEFYADFGTTGGRNSSDDVKKELLKLEGENVQGIVFDLRDNGGGSLQDAVKIVGDFIKSGPVVQVKGRGAQPYTLSDTDPSVVYSGPLVVMVNENSASASEIVAAALQDYHRAVIIGSNSTYGKGTVQQVFNLDDYVQQPLAAGQSLGSLKLTIQKFYRVNGGSTQLKGVTPDIILPDVQNEIPNGEKENDYPLQWDQVTPAQYDAVTTAYNMQALAANSQKRVSTNSSFQLIKEEADEFKQEYDQADISLNFDKYSAEQKQLKDQQDKFDKAQADSTLNSVNNLAVDLDAINADTTHLARNKEFLKALRRDLYLHESVSVINDIESGIQTQTTMKEQK